jgi:UDP-N-acetylmuramoyl-tripeptide--D-alanyl-D-alanine ligase
MHPLAHFPLCTADDRSWALRPQNRILSVRASAQLYFDVRMNRRTLELWIRQVALGPLVSRCGPLLFVLGSLWRRLLFRTTFIAVTGSVGKTTTKEFLADILATRGRTFRTLGNQNGGFVVPLNILRVRPWHRFAVIEIGVSKPGAMRPLAEVVRPDVALILGVVRTHTTEFQDLDQHADEKAVLLQSLAPGGLAILNGDDARVAKMGANLQHRVCWAGTSSDFDFWIDRISSRWPERLRFRIHRGDEACDIQTRQLGIHWASHLAAAIAAAHSLGVSISRAAAVLRETVPYAARMEPVLLPSGAVLIRDDYNGSMDTFEVALRVLREAEAVRKVLVITDFADAGLNRRARLRYLASEVSGWLDVLVLSGPYHEYGRRKAIEAGMRPDQVHSLATLSQLAGFVKQELRSGDLALLRGRGMDHAARIFFAQLGTVTCWREDCTKQMLCDTCWELGFQPDASHGGRAPLVKVTEPKLRE